jgi:hypothetical protein
MFSTDAEDVSANVAGSPSTDISIFSNGRTEDGQGTPNFIDPPDKQGCTTTSLLVSLGETIISTNKRRTAREIM